ncbi:hypothetical protein D3C80_2204810 [compost metagenome]
MALRHFKMLKKGYVKYHTSLLNTEMGPDAIIDLQTAQRAVTQELVCEISLEDHRLNYSLSASVQHWRLR